MFNYLCEIYTKKTNLSIELVRKQVAVISRPEVVESDLMFASQIRMGVHFSSAGDFRPNGIRRLKVVVRQIAVFTGEPQTHLHQEDGEDQRGEK